MFFLLIIAIVVAAAISGGGGGDGEVAEEDKPRAAAPADDRKTKPEKEEPQAQQNEAKPQAEPKPKPEYKVGQTAKVANVTWEVSDAYLTNQLKSNFGTQKRGRFVVVDFTFTNNRGEEITLDPELHMILKDSSGREFGSDVDAWEFVPTDLNIFLEPVNPGVSTDGRVIYEVAADANGFTLKLDDVELMEDKSAVFDLSNIQLQEYDSASASATTSATATASPAGPEASQEQAPEDVLAIQYEYINSGDYENAYALFAQQSQQIVPLEQYSAFFEANAPYVVSNYSFPSVQVQSETATVEVAFTASSAGGEGQFYKTQKLVQEAGGWRVIMRDDQVAAFLGTG